MPGHAHVVFQKGQGQPRVLLQAGRGFVHPERRLSLGEHGHRAKQEEGTQRHGDHQFDQCHPANV